MTAVMDTRVETPDVEQLPPPPDWCWEHGMFYVTDQCGRCLDADWENAP